MKIIKTSRQLNPNLKYKLLTSDDSKPIEEALGMQINVDALILYTDVDRRSGEERTFVKIADVDGEVYSTGGSVLVKQITKALDFCDGEPGWTIGTITPAKVKGAKSKGAYYTATINLRVITAQEEPNETPVEFHLN